jgi:hypothetical protein
MMGLSILGASWMLYVVSLLWKPLLAFHNSFLPVGTTSGDAKIRNRNTFLGVLSTKISGMNTELANSTNSRMIASIVDNSISVTPLPKYPTERGSTVDSRKIVQPTRTVSLRVAHILFVTEAMAILALQQLTSSTDTTFREMASQISACTVTRCSNGDVGWIQAVGGTTYDILPAVAQSEVFQRTTKPGDIIMVQSPKGVHLVQIIDMKEKDVSKMMTVRKPRRRRQQPSSSVELYVAQKPRYYKIETMGCQMNLADSERMEGQLHSMGIFPCNDREPDIVVFNTCSIRDHAEQKVYSYLGPYTKRKREHVQDDLILVVAGCVAQQEGETLMRRIPEIDLIIGPQYSNRISDLLEDVITNKNQVVATEATHIMEDYTKPKRSSTITAWVNVIYGCNERCTYCIVPTTRGVEQSRPVDSIVEEVKDLVLSGYKGEYLDMEFYTLLNDLKNLMLIFVTLNAFYGNTKRYACWVKI